MKTIPERYGILDRKRDLAVSERRVESILDGEVRDELRPEDQSASLRPNESKTDGHLRWPLCA